MTKSRNFADLLFIKINDEKKFRNTRRGPIKSVSKDVFLFFFLTNVFFSSIHEAFLRESSFFLNETIFSRKRSRSFSIIKQRSCVLIMI